jgi:hypothetical protein
VATTQQADLSSDRIPVYNISGSCMWTLLTLIPLAVLLVLIAI